MKPLENENPLVVGLLDTVGELPEVETKGYWVPNCPYDEHQYDAQVDLSVAGSHFTLLIEIRKSLFPRDVRQLLWQIGASRREALLPFLVAESISPGAKELLRRERVGYYDSGGSLYLSAPGAYIYIDKPPPKPLVKSVRTLFSGRRAQVLHALLIHHRRWFGVTELAKHARVSPATTSQVLSELERFDWMETRGQGPGKERFLRDPTALLDTWSRELKHLRGPALRRYYVPGLKAEALLERIREVFAAHAVEYAVTHEAAAQHYEPFLSGISQVRVRIVMSSGADTGISELGARTVNEGANLAVIGLKSSDELLFRENVDGLWLASSIQIYLDLLRGEGRSKELAEHFRKERIGY